MVRKRGKKKEIVVTIDRKTGRPIQHVLPKGIRAVDLDRLDYNDDTVICELYCYGKRSRYWFEINCYMEILQKLKALGIVEPVRLPSGHYAYDLTKFAIYARNHHII